MPGNAFAWLIASVITVILSGCLLEPKIVTKPSGAVRMLLPSREITATPMPVTDTSGCPLAQARFTLHRARAARLFMSRTAAAEYRDALKLAIQAMESGCGAGCGHDDFAATHIYDKALEGLLRAAGAGQRKDARLLADRLNALGIDLIASPGFMTDVEPDEIWFARDYVTFRVREPMRTHGLGVPLIVYKKPRPRDEVIPEMFYPPHWKFAATAIARPVDPGTGRMTIELVDPLEWDSATVAGAVRPLERDLTTPLIHLLSHSGYRDKSRRGLIFPNRLGDEEGVMLTHPYRPGKIPFVVIHGMGCSPRIMADIVSAVHSDPDLRARYQVMIVYYTTGDTILQDSAVIRRAFAAMRNYYDPAHSDSAWDQSVVLGHSLGGPIARVLTSHSDDHYEKAIFTRPWNQIVLSEPMRQAGQEAIFFEPVPEFKRVIHVASTMKGSRLADQFEARALSRVIPRRRQLQEFYEEIIKYNGREAFQPEYRDRPPSSIDNQSPESPFLAAAAVLRQPPDLITHSIQADWFPFLPMHAKTDGLVGFESSYIPEASTQVVLDWQDHFCTHDHRALAEIKRILHENIAMPIGIAPIQVEGQ
jgi:pimeloyl-ACP methyl ester carboxylesterase